MGGKHKLAAVLKPWYKQCGRIGCISKKKKKIGCNKKRRKRKQREKKKDNGRQDVNRQAAILRTHWERPCRLTSCTSVLLKKYFMSKHLFLLYFYMSPGFVKLYVNCIPYMNKGKLCREKTAFTPR